MRRTLLVSAALLAGSAAAARAQGGAVKASDVAGTWDTKASVGPKDSVVVTSVITVSADGKSWTMKYPNRDPGQRRHRDGPVSQHAESGSNSYGAPQCWTL